MELRQLEYFVAVAEEANFTRAAQRVHISQSGISAQIRQLEHDLGATLIDRSTRTATLTQEGEAVLEHARATLAAARAVRQAVDDVRELVRGRLVVGMVTACTVRGLFDALSEFHLAHPGVEITLVEDNSERLVEQVREGSLDLALVGTATGPPDGLTSMTIISEGIVGAVPPDHPLAGRTKVTLADIADYPIVSMPRGTGVRTVFDRACGVAGIVPNIALQASAPAAVADLAARGLGVAILSESMFSDIEDRLSVLAIDDVGIPAVLGLVWKRPEGPALRELLRHGRKAFGKPAAAPA
ncbi:LysR family transcriptional regulator [Rhodococcus sp. NPDC049939]|uniref:LysR family transcriptional regulator n=1 Tax=Rhodococcus sp. NPDC049939 TaxID=3155511 RepID=UPI0033D6C239